MTCVSKVLIVGGGIAGMSVAILLRRHGIDVTILERDPDWRVYGTGITITGPTLRAFERVGVLDAIRREGFISPPGRLFRVDGTPIGDLPGPPPREDLPGAGGILRPILHRILSERVRAAGVEVTLGSTIRSIAQDEDRVNVGFDSGNSASYDLVVGADGVGSDVRKRILPSAPTPKRTGQGAWRVLAPRPDDVDRAEIYLGGAAKVGLNPCSPDQLYLFALVPEDDSERIDDTELAPRLRDVLAPFGGHAALVRDGITVGSSIVYRPLETLLVEAPWHVGRVVLIGDAVHATTPHLASGAGMAVEDAVVLASLLAARTTLKEALEAFTAARAERCRIVVENSIALGEIELGRADPAPYNMLMRDTATMLAVGEWGG